MSTATQTDLAGLMADIGAQAVKASRVLATASTVQKNQALMAMAASLRAHESEILAANNKDVAAGEASGLSAALIDRLKLDPGRIEAMAKGIEDIAALADPVGETITEWDRPNGLRISRVRVPLGVIGIIYESRPNVTADTGALCLKAGNAAILRGGSEAVHSNRAILACLHEGLVAADLPEACVTLVPTQDRDAVGILLGMSDTVDVIVPRGGRSLVERVQAEARVPVFAHLEGICHVYVHRAAQLDMAREIAINAKMRRTSICGAAETLLIDRDIAADYLPPLVDAFLDANCEVRGDEDSRALDGRIRPASEEDWTTEYLEAIISIRVVDGIDDAIAHIEGYGSNHTDTIVTDDSAAAEHFLSHANSAIVMHNASTQFADGGEFGMGAEIGISTGKMHARGPVGVEQLTTFKYVVRGNGHVRP